MLVLFWHHWPFPPHVYFTSSLLGFFSVHGKSITFPEEIKSAARRPWDWNFLKPGGAESDVDLISYSLCMLSASVNWADKFHACFLLCSCSVVSCFTHIFFSTKQGLWCVPVCGVGVDLVLILILSVIYHLVFVSLDFFLAVSHPITAAACDRCHVFKQCARSVTSTKILVAAGSLLSWGNLRKTNTSLCPCTHHDCHELCGRRAKEMQSVLTPARAGGGRCPLAVGMSPSWLSQF